MTYQSQQIIFALNIVANLPSGRRGTAEKIEGETKALLIKIFEDPRIIELIGKWQLVWGPKVYQKIKCITGVADNAMYVAQNVSDPSQLVVAISGTNGISKEGWIVEDFGISPPVKWPYSASSTGNITHGTNVGIDVLLKTLKDNDKTLFKYLADQVSIQEDSISVTVTGHSLGGALSPVTALALFDSQGVPLNEPNGWDPLSKSKISVLPSAGPTPGDEMWRDYYESRLGENTDRIWNAIDIVPHAWDTSMLEKIPILYKDFISICEQDLVKYAIKKSQKFEDEAGSPLVQICPSVSGLCGKIDPTKRSFSKQVLYQHVEAYHELLQVTEFTEIVNCIKKESKVGYKCHCSLM